MKLAGVLAWQPGRSGGLGSARFGVSEPPPTAKQTKGPHVKERATDEGAKDGTGNRKPARADRHGLTETIAIELIKG